MTLTGSFNKIALKKYVDIYLEKVANAAITPGMLIELISTNKVRAHATSAGDVTPKMFACEDEYQGKDIDDAYAADDQVKCGIFIPGEEVYAILDEGENVDIGDRLSSNGNGYLKKHVTEVESWEVSEAGSVTVYPEQIVGIAAEAKDLSGSSGEEESSGSIGYNKRIKVIII